MKKILLFTIIALSFFGAKAQNPLVGKPSLKLVFDVAQTKKWDFTVDTNNLLTINGTGGTPAIRLSDFSGTGNRILAVDANGDLVRTTVDPAATSTPGGSTTQLQYNNAGVFGGISGATSSGTNVTFGNGNARMTSPWVTTSIDDSNGNIVLGITATGSAVNYLQVANSSTGLNPIFNLTGTDTNIGLEVVPKGTGKFRVYANNTSQVNFSNNSTEGGGYLTSDAPSQALISGGGEFTGTGVGDALAWTARGTLYSAAWNFSGIFSVFTNSGLTSGNTFTPTERLRIDSDGNADFITGNIETNGTTRISNAGAGTFTTVDTGQGANELHAMNQNVQTSDNVTFANITGSVGSFNQVNSDNVRLDGNTISVTDTNGNLNLTGNGSGDVYINAQGIVQSSALTGYTWYVYADGNATNANGMTVRAGQNSGSGILIQFFDGDATDVGEITFSGTTTTYGTSSDERLKKDIAPTTLNPNKLIGLAKDFTWIETGEKQTGFIAQEVYKVFPWAVHAPDSGMWSVDYGQLTPLLAKGYEDNEARISELEKSDDKAIHWYLWTAIAGLTTLVLVCLYTISTLSERISKLENK
jgi:hypothetical protein